MSHRRAAENPLLTGWPLGTILKQLRPSTKFPDVSSLTLRFDSWRIAGMLFCNAQAEVSIHGTSNMASHCIFSTASRLQQSDSAMLPIRLLTWWENMYGLGHEIGDCHPLSQSL